MSNQLGNMAYYINNVVNNYLPEVTFDQIVPHSIFSQSILLIFSSLTITSVFLIFLVCVMVKTQVQKPVKTRRRRKQQQTGPRPNYIYGPITSTRGSEPVTMRDRIKKGEGQLSPPSHPNPMAPSSILRKAGADIIAETIRNSVMKNNRNKTLSLSGPINPKKFDGKPDKSWLKIDQQSSKDEGSFKFQGTSDFENQISSVDRADESGERSRNIFETASNRNNDLEGQRNLEKKGKPPTKKVDSKQVSEVKIPVKEE